MAQEPLGKDDSDFSKHIDFDKFVDLTHLGRWRAGTQKGEYGVLNVLDNDLETFWQSDGELPHFVEVQFPKVVEVSQVAIYTDLDTDESYTPQFVKLYAGYGRYDLHKIDGYNLLGSSGWQCMSTDQSSPSIYESSSAKQANPVEGLSAKEISANDDGPKNTSAGIESIQCSFLKIEVIRNYKNGKDCRIKMLKVVGPRKEGPITSKHAFQRV